MGNIRDWRESFSQLELAKLNEPERPAETLIAMRTEPVLVPDIAMPLHPGPVVVSFPQPIAPLAEAELIAAPAEAEPVAPASEVPPKPRKPAKRKPAAKRARKPATSKKAARRPAARKPRPKAATPRRKAVAASPVELEAPAIPLPDLATLLVEPAAPPAAIAPLPRKASLAHYRKGGLIEAIGFWLRTTARRAKAKLGASNVLAKSVESAGSERELEELKAENERLRRQLDALLALSDAAQFKFQS